MCQIDDFDCYYRSLWSPDCKFLVGRLIAILRCDNVHHGKSQTGRERIGWVTGRDCVFPISVVRMCLANAVRWRCR